MRDNPAIIVNDQNEYLSGWCAKFAPRFDGDDDNFVTWPSWTTDPESARFYSSKRAAERVIEIASCLCHWRVAAIAYSECSELPRVAPGGLFREAMPVVPSTSPNDGYPTTRKMISSPAWLLMAFNCDVNDGPDVLEVFPDEEEAYSPLLRWYEAEMNNDSSHRLLLGVDGYDWKGWPAWMLEHGIAPTQLFRLRIQPPQYDCDYWGEWDVEYGDYEVVWREPMSNERAAALWASWLMPMHQPFEKQFFEIVPKGKEFHEGGLQPVRHPFGCLCDYCDY